MGDNRNDAPTLTAEQAKLAAAFVRGEQGDDISEEGRDSLASALDAIASYND